MARPEAPVPEGLDDECELISILIPVRNEAKFLSQCLASIVPPRGMACEVIVIDDDSDDDSFRLAEDFAARSDVSVRVLRNPKRGKTAALNYGYAAARGSCFMFLGGDDLLVSEALAARAAAVRGKRPLLAQCRYRTFSESRPQLAGVDFPRPGKRDHVAGGAACFNRAFASAYFPIPEELPNEDTWLRAVAIAFEIPIRYVDQLGLLYRIHPGNTVGPFRSFSETDDNLRRRHAAYDLALSRFGPMGTPSGRKRLAALSWAEARRARRNWVAVLGAPGISSHDRQVMLANAAPWLYWIKAGLSRLRR